MVNAWKPWGRKPQTVPATTMKVWWENQPAFLTLVMSTCHWSSTRFHYPYLFTDLGFLTHSKSKQMTSHWKSNSEVWLETSPTWHQGPMPCCCLSDKPVLAFPLKIHCTVWHPLCKSGGKRSSWGNSGQVFIRGRREKKPRRLRASQAKRSKALSREQRHQSPGKCFLFLLSIRKWERGMWIGPRKDQTFKCFFPLRTRDGKEERIGLAWGAGAGWLASRTIYTMTVCLWVSK